MSGTPLPSVLAGALGEGRKAEGSLGSGFLRVRPQISCGTVQCEVMW